MISLICNLDGTKETFNAALVEAECFANLCVLSEKQCLHIRLLSEELLGMAYGLLGVRDGTFWIEAEGSRYELHLTTKTAVGIETQEKLMEVSTSGQNEMYKGVSGKIRQAMEWLLNPQITGEIAPIGVYSGMMLAMNPMYPEWSLACYRESVQSTEKNREWDELEKSVLGRLANDVRVGVRSNRAEIIVIKNFK